MLTVSIKEALNAGVDIGFLEREMEINEAEEWVPEQEQWATLQHKSGRAFNKSLDRILTGWAFETYGQRYDGGSL